VWAAGDAVKVTPETFHRHIVRLGAPQQAQLLGVRHREAIEQHVLGHRKDDRIGADAQGQRADCNRRQPRASGQHARGKAQISA
jgi:hypothetical protein